MGGRTLTHRRANFHDPSSEKLFANAHSDSCRYESVLRFSLPLSWWLGGREMDEDVVSSNGSLCFLKTTGYSAGTHPFPCLSSYP